jgi:hypothetical protein
MYPAAQGKWQKQRIAGTTSGIISVLTVVCVMKGLIGLEMVSNECDRHAAFWTED